MAEQFGLEQLIGQRAAILREKRKRLAAAEKVYRPRHQLLAGTGLPLNQHRQIGGRRLARQIADFDHQSLANTNLSNS